MSTRRKPGKHLPKVRDYILAARDKGMGAICVEEIVEKLGVEQKLVSQCFAMLNREGLLGQRDNSGMCHDGWYPKFYPIRQKPEPEMFVIPAPASVPYKRKVSWGGKKRILTLIRKRKPWVVEMWYEGDGRWFMYMDCPPGFGAYRRDLIPGLAAEDQPLLTRSQVSKNHYDLDGALKKCAALRSKYPRRDFRARDTSQGDYIMGAILI